MKRLFPILLALVVVSLNAREIKVLTIGNSFANDLVALLPQIAESAGKPLLLARANLSGCSLERHALYLNIALTKPGNPKGSPYKNTANYSFASDKKSFSLPEALSAQAWDYVTIQQNSGRSFKPETYEPHAGQLVAAIRKYAPSATILVHQTWAYREDHVLFKTTGLTQQQMFDGLVPAYRQLAERYQLPTIPSGTVIQNARKTPRWTYRIDPDYDFENPTPGKLPNQYGSLNPGYRWGVKDGKPDFKLDATHLNEAGRYLVACLFFEMLYDTSCLDLAYAPESLAPEDAKQLRQIAHETQRDKLPLLKKQ